MTGILKKGVCPLHSPDGINADLEILPNKSMILKRCESDLERFLVKIKISSAYKEIRCGMLRIMIGLRTSDSRVA